MLQTFHSSINEHDKYYKGNSGSETFYPGLIMIVKDIDDGHVAGLMGVRIDDRYKVNESTKEIIKITLKNQENV